MDDGLSDLRNCELRVANDEVQTDSTHYALCTTCRVQFITDNYIPIQLPPFGGIQLWKPITTATLPFSKKLLSM